MTISIYIPTNSVRGFPFLHTLGVMFLIGLPFLHTLGVMFLSNYSCVALCICNFDKTKGSISVSATDWSPQISARRQLLSQYIQTQNISHQSGLVVLWLWGTSAILDSTSTIILHPGGCLCIPPV